MAGRPRRCAECGVVYVSRKSQQTHCSIVLLPAAHEALR